jgi:PhnB protein
VDQESTHTLLRFECYDLGADGTNRGWNGLPGKAQEMTTTQAPEGWHTVTPRIVVDDAERLVAFLKQVFDATWDYGDTRPSELRIGDSVVMVSDAGPRAAMTAFLYVYVPGCDVTYRRALEAGARSIEEPFDTPYGDRRCMVEDRWGNTWQIATRS